MTSPLPLQFWYISELLDFRQLPDNYLKSGSGLVIFVVEPMVHGA